MASKRVFPLNLLDRFRSNVSRCGVASTAGKRLKDEVALLESIERDRIRFQCPGFGRTVEESIIWRELVDLELQEIDQHVGSI